MLLFLLGKSKDWDVEVDWDWSWGDTSRAQLAGIQRRHLRRLVTAKCTGLLFLNLMVVATKWNIFLKTVFQPPDIGSWSRQTRRSTQSLSCTCWPTLCRRQSRKCTPCWMNYSVLNLSVFELFLFVVFHDKTKWRAQGNLCQPQEKITILIMRMINSTCN